MWGILGLFLQAAAGQVLYWTLRLETGSFPRPLTPAEERAAFAALRAGDSAARERLICHNLRLVAHVAKKYYAAQDSTEDLVSIGTIGLIKAVDRFDAARGIRFSSFASQCIENELRMYLRKVRREGPMISLQDPLEGAGESGQLTLADALPDPARMEEDCDRRDAVARAQALIRQLPERERTVLMLRYGLCGHTPMTQQQVAARLGLSRSYISRLEKRALARLAERWEGR